MRSVRAGRSLWGDTSGVRAGVFKTSQSLSSSAPKILKWNSVESSTYSTITATKSFEQIPMASLEEIMSLGNFFDPGFALTKQFRRIHKDKRLVCGAAETIWRFGAP